MINYISNVEPELRFNINIIPENIVNLLIDCSIIWDDLDMLGTIINLYPNLIHLIYNRFYQYIDWGCCSLAIIKFLIPIFINHGIRSLSLASILFHKLQYDKCLEILKYYPVSICSKDHFIGILKSRGDREWIKKFKKVGKVRPPN